MDEKKRIAKGIKLNASQLPLSNKADFVIGADSRKVLDNKIIENLSGSGSHGYFPSTVGRDYKSWSVSRELEIPSQAAEAEAQMRMIEGASAAEPLQNDVGGTASSQSDAFFAPTDSTGEPASDPFFMQGAGDDTNPFAHEPKHADNLFGTPAADPALAAQLVDTFRETLPRQTPEAPSSTPAQPVDADAPSPWSGPIADSPAVVKQNVAQNQNQEWAESPWAGPEMAPQSSVEISEPGPTSEPGAGDEGWMFVETPEAESSVVVEPNVQAAPQEPVPAMGSDIIPSWMSAMATDATTGSEGGETSEETIEQAATHAEGEVELETFLNSIPDEEFIIDNETMRHLFSSLCEPKTNSMKVKSPAREAADLAIAAAAAEILKTEVSIDEISIEDIATEEVLAAEVQTNFSVGDDGTSSGADFEAIQKAYAMLDLSPLPVSKRKEGLFDNVFDVIEKAAEEQVSQGEREVVPGASGKVSRTERGTIEMAIHAGGRQLVPQYNFCGMLTGVEMSDGLSFRLSEEKNTWEMIEQSGKVMVSGIQSVSFDKQGNLSYVTKRGDAVTLKVDGTIDTKFAKKVQSEVPAETVASAGDSEVTDEVKATVSKTPTKQDAKTPTKQDAKTPTKQDAKTSTKPAAKAPVKPAAKTPTNVKQSRSDAKPQSKTPKPQQQKIRQKQTKKGR